MAIVPGTDVIGLCSERAVRDELAPLQSRYFVRHDISLPFGGNIDHVVCGPSGAFAIETKTRRYLKSHLPLARRRGALAFEASRWTLGDAGHLPANSDRSPFQHERVWVVSASDLREWLEARRDRPVDTAFALRAL